MTDLLKTRAKNKESYFQTYQFSAFILATVFFILDSTSAYAASISLDPSKGSYGPGDTFVVTVRLDPDTDECVNVVSAEILYPKELIDASAVSKGESVLTLWTGEPSVDHERGVISFSGGVPAGYCGRILGDPGKTNTIAKIVFTIRGDSGLKPSESNVPFDITISPTTEVLQNDGFGTPAPLTITNAKFVRTQTGNGAPNEWLEIVKADNVPPDTFAVSLITDEKTFQGKHFIIFSTVDKQSGVHHFEVTEDDPLRFGMERGKKTERAVAVTATSPYVLIDQELKSRVIVRAYDHAGNIQETILAPSDTPTVRAKLGDVEGRMKLWTIAGASLLALFVLIGVFVVWRRSRSEPGVE